MEKGGFNALAYQKHFGQFHVPRPRHYWLSGLNTPTNCVQAQFGDGNFLFQQDCADFLSHMFAHQSYDAY